MRIPPTPARCSILLLAAAILFAGAAVAQHKARDKTVGASTRKDEFARQQDKIDALVQELVRADEELQPRLGAELAKKHGHGQAIENLIRYREPALKHVFVPLLEAKHWPIQARALYALKRIGDETVVPAVVKRLKDANPRIRELAANCLGHIGRDAAALEQALAAEKDRFTRASLEAAVALVGSAARPYRPWPEKLVGPEDARRVEWAWTVQGPSSFNEYDAKTLEYPAATTFDWPISWYHDSLFMSLPRQSFGGKSGHAGEDIAWFREGASVFAVADGLVRMVQGAGGNWGFLVLVEHRLESGDYFCSLYGHLGWDILVKPGDIVSKGQKIATVGLSCSVENGGYGAHLHFGIADSPFRRPKGIYRDGSALNFDYKGKRVKAPVIGYVYLPDQKDQHGFPGLGLKVKTPDGEVLTVAVGNVPMGDQVGWIAGYAPNCRGWFDPYKFLRDKGAPGPKDG
ncbi:MAG: peptidoglycan DD-metalloendopeptidase family protein [Planctomycetes bacterium]|nr:peptidoglycan DD-metalloendopeptidase family protein [Planctomycetota bacterium]